MVQQSNYMKKILFLVAVPMLMSCGGGAQSPADYVDPFIGTDGHGHTFPGATTPFGLVQVSPDTGTQGWDWCSGYHSSDISIIGFSHTHLSGTGGADLGDLLLMPSTKTVQFDAGTKDDPDSGYRSRFKREDEMASAGYYSVFLGDHNVDVELTATPHCAYHKYQFEGDNKHVMVDLRHGIQDNVNSGELKKVGDNAIAGFRRSNGWADDHTLFYYIEFSQPIDKILSVVDSVEVAMDNVSGREVVSAIMFADGGNSKIEAKVGISYVDVAGAKNNLKSEIGDNTFAQTLASAKQLWNNELSKIEVEGSKEEKVIFYTALYHSMIAPYLMSDVDGRYISSDRNIYTDTTTNNYGLFSLWDTFRALHPLLTIVEPSKNEQFINSLLRYYQQGGRLPVWDLNMRENNCMIGYHSIPVIADAYMKGQRGFDADLALEAMLHSAMQENYAGLKYYRQFGYLPMDKENNAVSKALEYSYDDWCIAQMAKEMGNDSVYKEYIKRGQYYKNQLDKDGFMKGRDSHGKFRDPFSPTEISILGQGDFTEGNSWHYSFFVPQDVNTHIALLGGDEAYVAKLDEMFNSESVTADHSPDVTGLIGNYAQGNEPSHHAAYLYAYTGQPWKTQQMIARIKREMYTDQRDGLCGNEDCGQMSAWYVLSAMGFYPVTPASNIYVLGSPSFKKATIKLENGKTFTIKAEKLSEKNFYIQSATFDGQPYTKSYITHDMIESGGELTLVMSETPNKDFGSAPSDRPVTVIENGKTSEELLSEIVFEPYLDTKTRIFTDFIEVQPMASNADATIHYTLNGSEPTASSPKAVGKIKIDNDKVLKIRAISPQGSSSVGEYRFYKGLIDGKVIGTEPAKPYEGKGLSALNDGLTGGNGYKNPEWIGYVGQTATLETTFEPKNVKRVGFNAVNSTGAWVLLPFSAKAQLFLNGKEVAQKSFSIPAANSVGEGAYYFGVDFPSVKADKVVWTIDGGKLPSWHTSKGNNGWMFIDELMVY